MQQGERVYGPYPDRGRFRIVHWVSDGASPKGRRTIETFETEQEALDYRDELLKQVNERTISVALEAYYKRTEALGCSSDSVTTTKHRLQGLHAEMLDESLAALDTTRAQELYEQYTEGRAPDTHRNALSQARTAGRFWVKQGWLAVNPWLDVEALGKRKRGKMQLRTDDTKRLIDLALSQPEKLGCLAIATQLLLGLRPGELVRIHARDLDCGGTVLRVPKSKTEAGIRELEIPAVLQPLLIEHAKLSPRLFPRKVRWCSRQLKKLCTLADVPVITAHALRGMHATIAIRRGTTGHAVAEALGHSSPRVTAAHYISPNVVKDLLGEANGSVSGTRG